jgi:hypothetical protein
MERLAFLFPIARASFRHKDVFVGRYRNALIHCISMLVQYCESFHRRIINLLDARVILRFCLRHDRKSPTTEPRTSCALCPPRILSDARCTTRLPGASPAWTPTKGCSAPVWTPPDEAARGGIA